MIHYEQNQFRLSERATSDATPLDVWRSSGAPLGAIVLVANTANNEDLALAASRASVIVLEFPTFVDGRAYSQARLLRQRYGFKGDLRASGNVLRDQALFMVRCGFSSLDVDGAAKDGYDRALSEFTFYYQSAADNAPPAWRLRADRARAA